MTTKASFHFFSHLHTTTHGCHYSLSLPNLSFFNTTLFRAQLFHLHPQQPHPWYFIFHSHLQHSIHVVIFSPNSNHLSSPSYSLNHNHNNNSQASLALDSKPYSLHHSTMGSTMLFLSLSFISVFITMPRAQTSFRSNSSPSCDALIDTFSSIIPISPSSKPFLVSQTSKPYSASTYNLCDSSVFLVHPRSSTQ